MNEITKRYDWLINVIKTRHYKIGAEIGCAQGFTTGRLLRKCHGLRCLYVVDLWAAVPTDSVRDNNYDQWDFVKVKRQFKEQTRMNTQKLVILQGISWEMAGRIKDCSLDFIFIDAGHTYECVKKDILAWTKKLRTKGMISGHDINMEGVNKAVMELIPNFKVTIDNCWEARKEDLICQ